MTKELTHRYRIEKRLFDALGHVRGYLAVASFDSLDDVYAEYTGDAYRIWDAEAHEPVEW